MESLVSDFEMIVASVVATALAGTMALLTIIAFLHLRRVSSGEPIQARRIAERWNGPELQRRSGELA